MKKTCRFCKEIIIHDEELYLEPKKDKFGNIKYNKNGTEQTFKSHKKCHEKNEQNKIDWKALTSYLESKYFVLTPKEMCVMLHTVAKKVEYKIILDCFKYLENNINKYIKDKDFNNDIVLSRYLFAVLKNNISTFQKRKKQDNLNIIQKNCEQSSVNNIEFLDIKQNLNVDDIDYDILD
jgi:hypothetical protein